MSTILPTPLKTILSPERYPFAVAYVEDGQIQYTVNYSTSLEEVHSMVKRRNDHPYKFAKGKYIMVQMQEIGEAVPNVSVNTYWCAI